MFIFAGWNVHSQIAPAEIQVRYCIVNTKVEKIFFSTLIWIDNPLWYGLCVSKSMFFLSLCISKHLLIIMYSNDTGSLRLVVISQFSLVFLGCRLTKCLLDRCEHVKVGEWTHFAVGATGSYPSLYKMFYWAENKYGVWCWDDMPLGSTACLPPTQAFELQEGRGAVTGPLGLITERESGFLSPLFTPSSLPST